MILKKIALVLGVLTILFGVGAGVAYYLGYFEEEQPPANSQLRQEKVTDGVIEPTTIIEPLLRLSLYLIIIMFLVLRKRYTPSLKLALYLMALPTMVND
ncbi:hypothetical protein JCM19235_6460 [Vibrio maritimus]|uniref:Uncharacterized protein n=1 Tax=Vibrio maritimus TaxID=990268 RepID=A0A090SEH5_9VIBR|nr:hypothetical protein JCM19235_6460 [Vibrio maritimus]